MWACLVRPRLYSTWRITGCRETSCCWRVGGMAGATCQRWECTVSERIISPIVSCPDQMFHLFFPLGPCLAHRLGPLLQLPEVVAPRDFVHLLVALDLVNLDA